MFMQTAQFYLCILHNGNRFRSAVPPSRPFDIVGNPSRRPSALAPSQPFPTASATDRNRWSKPTTRQIKQRQQGNQPKQTNVHTNKRSHFPALHNFCYFLTPQPQQQTKNCYFLSWFCDDWPPPHPYLK